MKRNCGMVLRFTKSEMDALTKKARKANMSREGYCRSILNGSEVKEGPSADVAALIWELRRSGSNLNQILKVANARGLLDVPLLRKAVEENHTAVQKIIQAYSKD